MSDKLVNKVRASTPSRTRETRSKREAVGVKGTAKAVAKERSVENGPTSTGGRAQQSLLGFKFDVFFADVGHSVGKLLSNFSTATGSPAIDSLFEPGLTMESTLLRLIDHADKGRGLEGVLHGGESVVELKRLADNIQNAKAGGVEVVLNECISESNKGSKSERKFEDAEKLFGDLEKRVNQLLEEKVEGYEPPTFEGISVVMDQKLVDRLLNRLVFKGEFSSEFSKNLFDQYSKEPSTDSESKSYVTAEGENMIVSEQAYKDLHRNDYVLVDKFGNRFESDRKTYPEFTQQDERKIREEGKSEGLDDKEIADKIGEKEKAIKLAQLQWKRGLVNRLLKFCGYDESKEYASSELKKEAKGEAEKKLLKLSRCLSQTMGNGYSIESETSKNSPQLFQDNAFMIGAYNAKTESHLELIEGSDGSLILKNIVVSRNIEAITVGTEIVETDGNRSYYEREVGIILDSNNEWKEYKGGKLEYSIVELI